MGFLSLTMNFTNTEQSNSTCNMTSSISIIATALHCVIIMTGIIGNTLILVVFRSQPYKKRPTYDLLIWYLSLFDLIGNLIAILEVYESITCYKHWPFGSFGCKTIYSFYYLSINISICILLVIALDRYRCLVTPFKKKFSSNEIHTAVFVSVTLSTLLQWYQFETLHVTRGNQGFSHCSQNRDLLIYTIPRTATILLRDIAFITVFFITTFAINRKLIERKKSISSYGFDNTSLCLRKKMEVKKVVMMITVMGITFGSLVLPLDTLDVVLLVSRVLPSKFTIPITDNLKIVDAALTTLQMCNSIINCFIYAKLHRYFRQHVRRLAIIPCLKLYRARSVSMEEHTSMMESKF